MGWIILIVMIAAYFGYVFISRYLQRRYLTTLSEADFRAGYRKAQLIDVREPDEFKKGHILGARNLPLTQLKIRKAEIRHDMPIYLYDANGVRSARAAAVLKKLGYKNLFQLQGGFKKWDGKIKKS
ncbi:rhodanese-like domain-containing protein [Sporolactobacillus sp. Y61]|jgi:rhodanese-related sulfurtransferase|uniref:Rhodanese-like domain-containing protein n=1 Tax=Sporolactobacillus sp. Y61 TaxID=3160863 RepID=A0AAU8IDY7_9BACL|nr:rhodanese-like domain-containing protein [Sporolactobacillus sp. THM19-2]RYL87833.1 rhodanese-like domain-containing protein [Sporolactobacillus sp. THM19-2]